MVLRNLKTRTTGGRSQVMREGIPNLRSLVEDCKLFNVSSTVMWTIIYDITRIARVCLLVRSEEIVKSIRKEMVMVGIHKTSNKKGIFVKNVKDIQFVEQGRRVSKMFCST